MTGRRTDRGSDDRGRAVHPAAPRAVAMVLGSAVSLQFGAAFAVILLGRVGAIGAVTLRLVIAACLVLLVARPRLRGRSRSELAIGVGFGVTLGAMNLCFYEAAARLPLGAAVTFEFLGPLGLAVLTGVLSRRAGRPARRLSNLAWVLLAGAGVWLLSEGGLQRLSGAGIGFALGAGMCWAVYIVLGSKASRAFPGVQALALALVVGSIFILPFAFVATDPRQFDAGVLALGLAVAVLSSAIPYSLELAALRRIPPRTFGILMSSEPAVAAVAGLVVLGQRLTLVQWVAIGLVIIACAGATTGRSPTP